VFRHPLREIFLLLSPALLAAAPAHAVLDVTDVTLIVTIAKTTLGSDEITAQLRVEGTDLNNGTIRLPSNPGIDIPLDEDGGVLGLDIEFANEQELNTVLTNGNYLLRVNNGTAEATIPYTRPLVPSPAISQPEGGEVVAPGPLEVMFTRCSECSLGLDSVEAVLEDDMGALLDEETLDETSESWVPQDGGGDLALPEQSAFVVRVTHTAVREASVPVDTDDDDLLAFSGSFVQSDEVDFETGFAPPSGRFCLAANHPAPPAGCHTLSDPLLQVFDTTGMTSTQVDGRDVDYTVSLEAGGQLTGTATADLDDNGSNETGPVPIKGKLKGGDGEVASKLSFSLANAVSKLKVSVTDELSIPGDVRNRLQRASGAIDGAKIKEEVSSSDSPLPDAPLGWLLEYDLGADGLVSNAELTLEGGRSFPLSGTNKFNFSSNQSSVKLQSDPKGVSVTLKKLGLDDSPDPAPMLLTEGAVSYRALGQSGGATLP